MLTPSPYTFRWITGMLPLPSSRLSRLCACVHAILEWGLMGWVVSYSPQHIHTRTHTCTRTHTYTRACTHTRIHTRAHAHTHTHTHSHTLTHTHPHPHTHTHTHTPTPTPTPTHTHTHTQIYTHTTFETNIHFFHTLTLTGDLCPASRWRHRPDYAHLQLGW